MENKKTKTPFEQIAYVFQGGGALGAYQVGVYKALAENGYQPDWVIGTSIGAINACIIAGNKPQDSVSRLEIFWKSISRSLFPGICLKEDMTRQWYNFLSAQNTILFGQPGFFYPRIQNPFFELEGSADTISFYVVEPLKKTLEKLVDFNLLNEGHIRLTLAAVEVQKGKAVFFDSKKQKIGPEHVMASCALPPGFPAIKIGKEYYWDGGVLSNTPVQAIIHDDEHVNTLCFLANLFDSYGLNPKTLDDVLKRHKDITYSSQDRMHLQSFHEILQLRSEIQCLYQKLPDHLKQDPEIKKIHKEVKETAMHFVRFLYTAPHTELSSKDFEFSKASVKERIHAGFKDGLMALQTTPWEVPLLKNTGVAIHEICSHPTVTSPWSNEESKPFNSQKP